MIGQGMLLLPLALCLLFVLVFDLAPDQPRSGPLG